MRYRHLLAGPRRLPDRPVESPELIQEQASWLKAHSPTNASAPSGGWGSPRSEKAYAPPHRTDPSLRFGTRLRHCHP
jgi:hypothetical protein